MLCAAVLAPWLQARAEAARYVEVRCDPGKQEVVIVPAGSLEDPSPTDLSWFGPLKPAGRSKEPVVFRVDASVPFGECLAAPGLPVRVKLFEGVASAHGQCGGNPEVWISLWSGQRKWISWRQIDGRCMEDPATRIAVRPGGITWCVAQGGGDGLQENPPEVCEDLPARRLPSGPDRREYPPAGVRLPEAGTVSIKHGGGNPLCRAMIERRRGIFGEAAWEVRPPKEAERFYREVLDVAAAQEPSGDLFGPHLRRFDLDNDGRVDLIYSVFATLHGRAQDILFKVRQPLEERLARLAKIWSEDKDYTEREDWQEAALRDAAEYVFPDAHGRCDPMPCRPGDVGGNLPLRKLGALADRSRPFQFRLENLSSRPFRYRGRTYILINTYTDPEGEAVVSVTPRHRLEEVCIFHRQPRNG